jgi:hypothetical protein
MDLGEIGGGSVDWMQLAQDRDRWLTCEYDDEPFGFWRVVVVVVGLLVVVVKR